MEESFADQSITTGTNFRGLAENKYFVGMSFCGLVVSEHFLGLPKPKR